MLATAALLSCVLAALDMPGFVMHRQQEVVNGTTLFHRENQSVDACAQLCNANSECVSFNFKSTGCVGSSWSPAYAIQEAPAGSGNDVSYYARVRQGNTSRILPQQKFALTVPTSGVTLGHGVLKTAFDANINYLLQFPVDDMLHWFRQRNGVVNPPGKNWGWDNGGVDAPYGLRGSVAGAFLMGTGGICRWDAHGTTDTDVKTQLLCERMHTLVQGIKDNQEDDGYMSAFPRNESNYHENPDYVTSWLTHGLLEAAVAGETDALPMLRRHFDWFNAAENLPEYLPPAAQSTPFFCVGPSSGPCGAKGRKSNEQFDHGHEIYLIYQGIIHNTRLALSAVGQQQDLDVAALRYAEDWWLQQLAARNTSAIWLRSKYPHNYEITAVEGAIHIPTWAYIYPHTLYTRIHCILTYTILYTTLTYTALTYTIHCTNIHCTHIHYTHIH
jgi:hypothetical protein